MIIINQLFRFSHAIIVSYPWIIFLIDPVYHLGYFLIVACMRSINSWFQVIIGTIAGFLVANLVLSISSAIPSSFQSVNKRTFQEQSQPPLITSSEYESIDTSFLESIERYPQPSKSNKPKPSPSSDLDSWTTEMQEQQQQQQQQQAENGYDNADAINATSNIDDDDDDDPGETSLFAENYITESEHNKALASLDYQIGRLIKQITKRDQLLQKSRVETIQAETMIDELQEEIKGIKANQEEKVKNKTIMKDSLQVSHGDEDDDDDDDEKKKEKFLINDELHARAPRGSGKQTTEEDEGFSSKDEVVDSSSHCIDHQEQSSLLLLLLQQQQQQQESTPIGEGRQKAKDIMTYIPPNRRPLSQA